MKGSKETKFVCKFCNQSYPCGKSLGGHIRIHKNEKSALQESKVKGRIKRESKSEIANGNSSYGLRENPKMTKRLADSRFISKNGVQRKELEEDDQSYSATAVAAAKILMMMSRDTRFSGVGILNSSSSNHHFRESVISASNSNGVLENEMKGGENSDYEDDSRKESCKKVKLKVSVNGSSLDDEYKKLEVKYGFSSAESSKNSMRNKNTSCKYDLRNKTNNDSYSPDLLDGSNNKMSNDCSIPSEIVHSHQIESHGCESTYRSGENSINTVLNSTSVPDRGLIESSRGKKKWNRDVSGNEEKKLGSKRRHKCPICSKVFKSGQALGGHKRSHTVGSLDDTSVVMKQETSEVTGLFDLNVPAPMEEEESRRWGSFY